MEQAIDNALSANPELDLLGLSTKDNADIESIRVRKTIYLPAPYVGVFLERDLTPDKVWSRL